RDWSARTCSTYQKKLSAFFKWCVSRRYCSSDPAKHLEIPKVTQALPAKLTKQAAVRLLDTAYHYPHATQFLRTRNHAVLATFLYTGLRKKELLRLRFLDVDLTNLSIFVYRGKGGKDRSVPICQSLAEILSVYMKERQ